MKKGTLKDKIKAFLKAAIRFIANPRLLLCFGIAWLITNGWSYIMLGIGTYYGIEWMIAVAGGYLTFLWLPISPEKILTVLIAMGLLKLIFPKDEKTLGVLRGIYAKYKTKRKNKSKSEKRENENIKVDETESEV